MKPPARRFVLIMLAATAIFVGGPVLLNYAVDPYDRFGNNRLGVYISAEREMKNTEVARYPHTALLLGNSRMAKIPVGQIPGMRFFNGAFPAASAEETYWFVLHNARRQDIVVLGIDMGTNDPPVLKGDIFRRDDWSAAVDHLVNLQTVEYSFKTLFSHWRGKPSQFLPDGTMAALASDPRAHEDVEIGKAHIESLKAATTDRVLTQKRSLTFYRKIADLLRERKIPCVVVLPPLHEEVVRHIAEKKMRPECDSWLADIRTIFPDIVDLTASKYGAAEGFYASDPVHYKPEVGARFMNEEVMPLVKKVLGREAK
jgi:hypothetical protein